MKSRISASENITQSGYSEGKAVMKDSSSLLLVISTIRNLKDISLLRKKMLVSTREQAIANKIYKP